MLPAPDALVVARSAAPGRAGGRNPRGPGGLRPLRAPTSHVLALVAVASLSCCGRQQAGSGETLTIAARADVTGFHPNPPMRNESYTFAINRAIYDPLVVFDGAYRLEPHLAARWESPDERTYVFELRDDVRFSDGQPLTARDVAASISAALERGWPVKDYLQAISSVKAVGPRRVEIRTAGSNLTLLTRLPWGYVSPASAVDQTPVPVVGSGPYRLESWSPGEQFVLVRNEHYWGPRPHFARVRYLVVPDDEERVAMVERGAAQMADHVPLDQLDRLETRAGLRLVVSSGHRVLFLGLRLDTPPFADPRVREAIDLAIDRRELIERALFGRAEPGAQIVPRGIVGYNPRIRPVPPDRVRARALLAEAGFPNGFATRLEGTANRYVNDVQLLHEVARQLAGVGIRAQPDPQDKSVFFPLVDAGRSPFHLLGWASETGDAGDAIQFLAHTPAGSRMGRLNTTAISDPGIDASYAAADAASSVVERSRHLQEALARIAALRAMLPLVVQTQAVVHTTRVEWDPPVNAVIHPGEVRRAR